MSDEATTQCEAADAPPSVEAVGEAANETRSTSQILAALRQDGEGDRISVGTLVDSLSDRAFGLFLLVLALPCAIPFLYGVPQVVAVPMLFVAAQIVIGRHTPWLPESLRKRTIERVAFAKMMDRGLPAIRFFEALAHPRLTALTHGPAERIVGVFLVAFCASILVPLPATNTVPGIAVAIVALGFIERDGLFVTLGLVLGCMWVSLLLTVGTSAIGLVFNWIGGLF